MAFAERARNKRLKLTGGGRFKGSGVLCPWRSAPLIRHPLSFCPAAVMALAVAACGGELTEPTHGVFLLTDAREYQLPPPSQPPMSMFATISNQTFAGVPVRRCFIRGSAVDPVGADLVFEEALLLQPTPPHPLLSQ